MIIAALVEHLRWPAYQAVEFEQQLLEHEREELLDHVKKSRTPLVGIAAVVYRARMRLADGDAKKQAEASREADYHFALIKKLDTPRPPKDKYPEVRPRRFRCRYLVDKLRNTERDDGYPDTSSP